MEKRIAKIGMIMVLTLALILSSLSVFYLDDNLSKEFALGSTQTAENAGGGRFLKLKTAI